MRCRKESGMLNEVYRLFFILKKINRESYITRGKGNKNYMKTNFYAQNKLGYTSYEKNGDLYIYKMVITNGENSSQTIEKQFVVKLLDGTNFVMSFEK